MKIIFLLFAKKYVKNASLRKLCLVTLDDILKKRQKMKVIVKNEDTIISVENMIKGNQLDPTDKILVKFCK